MDINLNEEESNDQAEVFKQFMTEASQAIFNPLKPNFVDKTLVNILSQTTFDSIFSSGSLPKEYIQRKNSEVSVDRRSLAYPISRIHMPKEFSHDESYHGLSIQLRDYSMRQSPVRQNLYLATPSVDYTDNQSLNFKHEFKRMRDPLESFLETPRRDKF